MARLQQRFGVSQRRASSVAGQHRSTQRKPPPAPRPADERLARRLREIAGEHPRWGWKTAHQILLREGWTINRKRTRRIWREEGLRRPVKTRKRRRLPGGPKQRLRARRPNEVWAIDFQFDETSDRRRIKLCNIVDEHTREALAIRVGHSCTADDVVEVITGLVTERGTPDFLRSDNGPEFIAWALRDYCRMTLMATSYIEPGSPWENPFVESFNGRPAPRRAAEHRGVRHARRREGRDRGLAPGVQQLPSPLSTRGTLSKRVRHHHKEQQPKQPRTRIAPGLTTGAPSRRTRPAAALMVPTVRVAA